MALLKPGDAADAYKAKILSYQAGADFLALLAAAPRRLADLIAGLPMDQLARGPAPDKWSIQEIAAHLADDELVGGYRIRLILSARFGKRISRSCTRSRLPSGTCPGFTPNAAPSRSVTLRCTTLGTT